METQQRKLTLNNLHQRLSRDGDVIASSTELVVYQYDLPACLLTLYTTRGPNSTICVAELIINHYSCLSTTYRGRINGLEDVTERDCESWEERPIRANEQLTAEDKETFDSLLLYAHRLLCQ